MPAGERSRRDKGSSDKGLGAGQGRPVKVRFKADRVRASLTAQEFHAYYIALISTAVITATDDGVLLRRP